MSTNHRKIGFLVLLLLVAATLVDHDGISIALSVAGLAIAIVALVLIFRARRAAGADDTGP